MTHVWYASVVDTVWQPSDNLVQHLDATPSGTMMTRMFTTDPTALESIVIRVVNDLRVSGFGQRIRAALRRNRAAGEMTILPEYTIRDLTGPDLVRHLNALVLTHKAKSPIANQFHDVDHELLDVLQQPLYTARQLVAGLWTGPLRAVASAFVDDDNLPIPFCPMYPDARDLVDDSSQPLPYHLVQIVEQLRATVEKTRVCEEATRYASGIASDHLRQLRATRDRFRKKAVGQNGETFGEWQERARRLLAESKRDVPKSLLAMNRLTTAIVSAMVSLSVWDARIDCEDLLEYHSATPSNSIPTGTVVNLARLPDAVVFNIDASFRITDQNRFLGIGTTKGMAFSWDRASGADLKLEVVRLSAYESWTLRS